MKPDVFWMRRALRLAKKAKDETLPNPKVGAIFLDENGEMLGEGYHAYYGGPHAELMALQSIEDPQKIHSLFVTLEPCVHQGKTGPCLDLLLTTSLKKIFIASLDPNPLVHGLGMKALQEAGIEVHLGLLENDVRRINEKFFFFHENKKPWITLKIASTLNAFIGPSLSEKHSLTCEKTNKKMHLLRRAHQAIAIGGHTLRVDNPHLGIRLVEASKDPLRIIFSRSTEPDSTLAVFRDENYWICQFKSVEAFLNQAYLKGIQSILIEGGPEIWSLFIKAKAFQELVHCMQTSYSPDAFAPALHLDEEVQFQCVQAEASGPDWIFFLRPKSQ